MTRYYLCRVAAVASAVAAVVIAAGAGDKF